MENVTCNNCGVIDDYNVIEKSGQRTAYCNGCGKYIKNIPYATKICLYIGKYSGIDLNDFNTPEHINYLRWVKQTPDLWKKLKPKVTDKINSLLNEK
jgi:hypothetical protein